jgi:hypothetical protein
MKRRKERRERDFSGRTQSSRSDDMPGELLIKVVPMTCKYRRDPRLRWSEV